LINIARAAVDELVVLVCSIEREPIPGAIRFGWVRDSHPDCVVVHVAEEVPQTPEEDAGFWPIWTDLIARYAGRIDVVFTSESYGDELARHIGARHVSVDRERAIVPVSGTAIREDPMRYWDFIPRVVRPYFVKRVALLGTESTGKTTLSQWLAQRFNTTWVEEYGRPYCETRPALTLQLHDFEAIAWGQVTWEEGGALGANRVLICDTDLHTTATWSDIVVGARPPGLTEAARARHYDLVLLLSEEGTPWVDDGLRVLSGRRAEHTRILRAELAAAGRSYVTLGGTFAERDREAERLVAELIETRRQDI
jgi:NadR type nicotinamide-nucleotide adenylyltransferase